MAEPDLHDDTFEADLATLRRAARIARSRTQLPRTLDHRDGLERLGAEKALLQLATDLEVTADLMDAERAGTWRRR